MDLPQASWRSYRTDHEACHHRILPRPRQWKHDTVLSALHAAPNNLPVYRFNGDMSQSTAGKGVPSWELINLSLQEAIAQEGTGHKAIKGHQRSFLAKRDENSCSSQVSPQQQLPGARDRARAFPRSFNTWRSLLKIRDMTRDVSKWSSDNGQVVLFWKDR
ncbi:hypothetical protein Nepgr_011503 [Nepenthes gracilis]|uniref:Uncharacterized protein n=1 Tax=Nepenthes gracilis TaxID=150966 RepID=A0AAD3SFK4_NEPGR|nr:hypothetical protein Nepgr_011503 [Nepenthes gracilis]